MEMTGSRFRRPPYRSLILATTIALLLTAVLVLVIAAPIPPSCFEWCGVEKLLAMGALSLVALVWLGVMLTVAWRWRATEPAIAAIAAVAAGLGLLVKGALTLAIEQIGTAFFAMVLLCTVMVLGLQLPPAWLLATRTHPRLAGPILARLMTAAAFVAAVAYVGLGTLWGPMMFISGGPQVIYWVEAASVAGLILLGFMAWRAKTTERYLTVLPVAGLLYLCIVLVFPGISDAPWVAYAVGYLVLAVAWFVIGIAWLRRTPLGRAVAA